MYNIGIGMNTCSNITENPVVFNAVFPANDVCTNRSLSVT